MLLPATLQTAKKTGIDPGQLLMPLAFASILGGTCTLIGTYEVTAADVAAGRIDNTGTADSDQTPPEEETVPVDVPESSLSFSKVFTGYADNDRDCCSNCCWRSEISFSFAVIWACFASRIAVSSA